MDNTELLLKEITEVSGVSGYETEVRKIIAREMNGLVDDIEYDKMGSIMGRKVGSSKSPNIMIISHMDEIGFMVKEITEEGYIKFLPLGGWLGSVAYGHKMRVITSKGTYVGVIGTTPPHMVPVF